MNVKPLKFKLDIIMNYFSIATLFKYALLVSIVFIYALSIVNVDIPLYGSNTALETDANATTVMHASLKN